MTLIPKRDASPVEVTPAADPVSQRFSSLRSGLLVRFSTLYILQLAARALGFVATLAVARYLGPEDFGRINLAQSLALFGVMVSALGIDTLAVRNVAMRPNEATVVASTVIVIRSVLAVPVYTALLLVALLFPPFHSVLGLLAIFGLSLFVAGLSLTWLARALHRSDVFGYASFATQALYLGLVTLAIGFELGAWSIPLSLIVAEGAVTAAVFFWSRSRVGKLQTPLPLDLSVGLLKQALPLGVSKGLRTVALTSDIVLLGVLLSMQDVGWYAAAFKFYLLGNSLVITYSLILLPLLSRQAAGSRRAAAGQLRLSLIYTVPLGVAGLAVVGVFSGQLLALFFGPQYTAATVCLQILLIALLCNLASAQLRNFLQAVGWFRQDLRWTLLGTLTHISMKVILIPVFGIAGAAIGTLLGELIQLFGAAIATRRSLHNPARVSAERNDRTAAE